MSTISQLHGNSGSVVCLAIARSISCHGKTAKTYLELHVTVRVKRTTFIALQDELLVHKAETCFNEAWKTLNSDGWKEEKRSPEGDVVHSKFIGRTHKIFKVTVTAIAWFSPPDVA